ncbi:hypothetical protein HBB16_10505 [Pseudonocardia sp. MCCB 268]|nr:hypothetical protein [Pseudonocardia cytotoxica]
MTAARLAAVRGPAQRPQPARASVATGWRCSRSRSKVTSGSPRRSPTLSTTDFPQGDLRLALLGAPPGHELELLEHAERYGLRSLCALVAEN